MEALSGEPVWRSLLATLRGYYSLQLARSLTFASGRYSHPPRPVRAWCLRPWFYPVWHSGFEPRQPRHIKLDPGKAKPRQWRGILGSITGSQFSFASVTARQNPVSLQLLRTYFTTLRWCVRRVFSPYTSR